MPTVAGALPRRATAGYTSPRAVLVVMCVGYFLVLLDVTIVNVALPNIGAGLDAGVSGLQWVVDGYALALASLMLAGGTVGDLHGHRRVVLAGLIVFGAGSLLCGVAPSAGVLVGARLAQGVGAALLLPGTLAIISRAFPEPRAQARAIGVWAAIGSLALGRPARRRVADPRLRLARRLPRQRANRRGGAGRGCTPRTRERRPRGPTARPRRGRP